MPPSKKRNATAAAPETAAVLRVEMIPIDRVIPYARNPRRNEHAVAKVAGSIKEFGFRQPIVVDKDMVIIAGHTRLLAAQQLGLKSVPVHVAEGLTAAQIKAYRLADNRTHEDAEWDEELLSIELGELKEMDFDLDLTGFDPDELTRLMASEPDAFGDPDDVPAPPDNPVTCVGDRWLLGEHVLLCGDSSKAEDVDRLLGGAKIQLVNTDPPYNVKVEPRSNNAIAAGLSSFGALQSSDSAKGTTKKLRAKDRPLANDFISDDDFDQLLLAWFGNMARVLEPGRSFLFPVSTSWTNWYELLR